MADININEYDDEEDKPEISSVQRKNYMTPCGLAALQEEFTCLKFAERPKIVETVRWAAGNGDRSENGDYIYGKKRLREIDKRLRYLMKRIDSAVVVDPTLQKNLTKVYFGATVSYVESNGTKFTVKLVGADEADFSKGKISFDSPIAKALLKRELGDVVTLSTPNGETTIEIVLIKY
jgi:transcription elongation factor GreB